MAVETGRKDVFYRVVALPAQLVRWTNLLFWMICKVLNWGYLQYKIKFFSDFNGKL